MSSDTNDNIRKISEDRSSIHVIIYWPELFCYPIKSVGLISSSAGFCLWLFRSSSVHPCRRLYYKLLVNINQPIRLSSSRAVGHIGQQLDAILNGQLQHIQPPSTWSRPSANPAGKFWATSSWGVRFYASHSLEPSILPLSPLDASGKRSIWPAPYGICGSFYI